MNAKEFVVSAMKGAQEAIQEHPHAAGNLLAFIIGLVIGLIL